MTFITHVRRTCKGIVRLFAAAKRTVAALTSGLVGCLSGLDSFAPQSHGCVRSVQTMQVGNENICAFCQPAALGEQIDGLESILGRWAGGRDRLFFYVMVARAEEQCSKPCCYRVVNHVTLGGLRTKE